jgi:peptide/nickel transport system substrate-binding protein
MFMCGTPLETDVGSGPLLEQDLERAKELLAESSYDGQPIVIMYPTDVITLSGYPPVTAQAMEEVGFNVDLQAMDWQTVVARRASMDPPEEGGWHMFHTWHAGADCATPASYSALRGTGERAWFGWPEDEQLEALRAEFIAADTLEKQQEVAKKIQAHTLEQVIYVPLGQYLMPQARRANLTGMIPSPVPVFWNVDKEE